MITVTSPRRVSELLSPGHDDGAIAVESPRSSDPNFIIPEVACVGAPTLSCARNHSSLGVDVEHVTVISRDDHGTLSVLGTIE